MRVGIVGGGIGGLTLAHALRQRGHEAVVFERRESFGRGGAGITLQPNAMAVYEALGLAEALRGRGRRMTGGALTDAAGRTLSAMTLDGVSDHPSIAIHRGDLHDVLRDGVEVRMGAVVEGWAEEPLRVDAEPFDLLVGADGLRSAVRRRLWPDDEPRYAGYTCWRVLCPNPGVEQTVEMWGAGARVGLVPLAGDQLYVFLVLNGPARTDPSGGDPHALADLFAGFGGAVPAVMDHVRDGCPYLWHDIEEVSVVRWGQGAVALIGDAAHGLTPNMGQGAAMAIEDAAALAVAVDAGVEGVVERLAAVRDARVRAIWTNSRRFGAVAQWAWGPAATLRNLAVRWMPTPPASRLAAVYAPAEPLAAALRG